MAAPVHKYKVKGNIREWNDGAIVTEEDLKKYPEMGGVARLRDEMGVLEDFIEDAPSEPLPIIPVVLTAEEDGPNVHRARRSGKS